MIVIYIYRDSGLYFKDVTIVNCTSAMFVEDTLVILKCKQNMTSLRGQASWAKMTPLGGKLTGMACHPTKYVNKAE
jgi:hypothetical protein